MSIDNDWTIERVKQRLEKIKSEIEDIYVILKDL